MVDPGPIGYALLLVLFIAALALIAALLYEGEKPSQFLRDLKELVATEGRARLCVAGLFGSLALGSLLFVGSGVLSILVLRPVVVPEGATALAVAIPLLPALIYAFIRRQVVPALFVLVWMAYSAFAVIGLLSSANLTAAGAAVTGVVTVALWVLVPSPEPPENAPRPDNGAAIAAVRSALQSEQSVSQLYAAVKEFRVDAVADALLAIIREDEADARAAQSLLQNELHPNSFANKNFPRLAFRVYSHFPDAEDKIEEQLGTEETIAERVGNLIQRYSTSAFGSMDLKAQRAVDVVLALLLLGALTLILPLFPAALLLLPPRPGRGDTFFVSERMGHGGRLVPLYQFRMTHQGVTRPAAWIITFLQWTGLDKAPALINVLRGEISIVGPHPLYRGQVAALLRMYPGPSTVDLLYKRLAVRPGLIGYAQLDAAAGDLSQVHAAKEVEKEVGLDPVCIRRLRLDSVYVGGSRLKHYLLVVVQSIAFVVLVLLPQAFAARRVMDPQFPKIAPVDVAHLGRLFISRLRLRLDALHASARLAPETAGG